MSKLTFDGGIFPPLFKKNTQDLLIKNARLPKKVVIPFNQHSGENSKPVVKKGDYVLAGQKIGEARGKLSLTVHSSISGTVIDICPWNHPKINEPVLSAVIESDGRDLSVEVKKTCWDYFRYPAQDIIKIIQDSGIGGMGGDGYPAAIKLSSAREVDAVIINGCESEPFITCDDRLMQENAAEVIEGLKIIMYILDAPKGFIAIEDDKINAFKALNKEVFKEPNITIKTTRTKYPQGSEKQLVKTIVNRIVSPGHAASGAGVVVFNAATSHAIRQAIVNGVPPVSRIVTVTGRNIKYPGNYRVRLGTLVSDLLEQSEFDYAGCGENFKIIFGGPMKGIAQFSTDTPITSTVSGIVVLEEKKYAGIDDFGSCIRCGKCVKACPMGLMPNFISIYSENSLWGKCREFYPEDCLECGCCAYECVSKRPIVQQVKLAKQECQCNH